MYAAADGPPEPPCTLVKPCKLPLAISLATMTAPGLWVRMLPGTYTSTFEVSGEVSVVIVGTGATYTGPLTPANFRSINVDGGANVLVRDLAIDVPRPVRCGDGAAPFSALSLVRSPLRLAPGMSVAIEGCTLRLSEGRVDNTNIQIASDATFEADRMTFHARDDGGSSTVTTNGRRMIVRITNSVLDGVMPNLLSSDPIGSTTERSLFSLAFNTIALTSAVGPCENTLFPAKRTITIENNIFAASASSAISDVYVHYSDPDCVVRNNLLWPDPNAPAGNFSLDPTFADVAAGNYRLLLGSPAIGAALPSTALGATLDLDGVARPQGAAPDIGAFEFTP